MKKNKTFSIAIFILLFVLAPHLYCGETQTIEGHWTGTIDLPTMKLEIDIDFLKTSEGAWKGDISIPAQHTVDMPLGGIDLKENSVTFAIQGIPGDPVFKGTLSEDGSKISGDFIQGGQTFPFSLERGAAFKVLAKKALSSFDTLVERGLKELKVPGAAVAVVAEDEVILSKGYGLRNIENKVPMTENTLLAIGSASKAFTTFAMGVLVDKGELEWEVPVRNYIPWFTLYDTFASERMTPRDLVTHRSGLPRHDLVWYNNLTTDRETLVRRLAYLKPTADLRTKFQYNNLMFLTAGYLVEVLAGKPWEKAIRDLVFTPLNMKRTNFSVIDSQKDPDHALPYIEREGNLELIPFRDITTVGPAGSINSCAAEMSRWVLVHINRGKFKEEQIINPQTIQDMHLAHMPTGNTPALKEVTPADYGLGWFVDTYRGHQRVHHGGNIDGFSAMVSLFPQDRFGMVVLTNKNGTGLTELLVRHAADLILGYGDEKKDWIAEAAEQKARGEEEAEKAREKKAARKVKGTQPAHKLEAYHGIYAHPGYGSLEVKSSGKGLVFVYNEIQAPLEHWHYETFNAKRGDDPTFEDTKLTFRTDVNGYVAAVEAPFEPTLDAIVFTKKPDARLFNPDYLKKFVGDYTVAGQTVSISLKGNGLTLIVPGQPEYDLVPSLGDEFVLKQVKILRIHFKMNDEGDVTALELIQPGGITESKRVEKK